MEKRQDAYKEVHRKSALTQKETMTRRGWANTPKPGLVQGQQLSAPPRFAPQQLVVGEHYVKEQLLYCHTNELFRTNFAGFVPLESLVVVSEEDMSGW